jgi:hypothetical protein
MIQNRFSPRRPAIAALTFTAAIGGLYALGYRGRNKPGSSPLPFSAVVELGLKMLVVSFLLFYFLRILGVEIGPMGGKENTEPSEKGPVTDDDVPPSKPS